MVHRLKKDTDDMAEFKVVFDDNVGTVQLIHDNIIVAKTKKDVYDDVFDSVKRKLGGGTKDYKKWAKEGIESGED